MRPIQYGIPRNTIAIDNANNNKYMTVFTGSTTNCLSSNSNGSGFTNAIQQMVISSTAITKGGAIIFINSRLGI